MQKRIWFGISTIALITISIIWLIQFYEFRIGCDGYLKRAADANKIQTAKVELRTALAYMQVNEMTSGHVSIFLKQPKNDIGFWYKNLSEALEELESVPDSATQLERSNVLMKLRETILDETENGTVVTKPYGISIHPHNRIIVFLLVTFGLIWVVTAIAWWAEMGRY